MKDLVKRLREYRPLILGHPVYLEMCDVAAARIEELECALGDIIAHLESTDAVVVLAGDALHKPEVDAAERQIEKEASYEGES